MNTCLYSALLVHLCTTIQSYTLYAIFIHFFTIITLIQHELIDVEVDEHSKNHLANIGQSAIRLIYVYTYIAYIHI